MLSIDAFPRLHIGLLDLGGATPRAYGGLGIAVDGLPLTVEVRPGDRFTLEGAGALDARGASDLWQALRRLFEMTGEPRLRLTLQHLPPQHIGLGSKTALTLAALQAVSIWTNANLTTHQLQLISGRGGASGVGVHTFFRGGLVVDAGHRAGEVRRLGPSSSTRPLRVPPLVAFASIPDHWTFTLVIPSHGFRHQGREELQFFVQNTPIPQSEVLEAMALAYHGLVPAVLEDDFASFRDALASFQDTGFKRREVAAQSVDVQELLTCLREETPAAVGMSSLGPLLYAVTSSNDPTAAERVREVVAWRGATALAIAHARNKGFEEQWW